MAYQSTESIEDAHHVKSYDLRMATYGFNINYLNNVCIIFIAS